MPVEQDSQVTIALADDHAELRRMLEMLLEDLGYRVACSVGSGKELLEACFPETVDVALLDLDMPELDGLAAAEEVAARGIPVVLISGHPDADEVVLEHEPIVARITKPATVEAIQAAIRDALSFKSRVAGPIRRPR
jgi:DNA-binding NtrC family response regulator